MFKWSYEGYPESFEDVVCWCTGDNVNYHKIVMYVNENNNWSEEYDVVCWMRISDPE